MKIIQNAGALTDKYFRKPSGYEQDAPGRPENFCQYILSGQISGGVTTEKDSGKFFSWKPPEVEYISAHLAYSGSGFLRR